MEPIRNILLSVKIAKLWLEKKFVEWYHNTLCHPGETHTELSISHHFYWNDLHTTVWTVHEVCTKCKTCQILKRNKKQYGKLPPKEAETKPWDILFVDITSIYQITSKGGGKKFQITPKGDVKKFKMTTTTGKAVYLQAVTMIDPGMGCKEIRTVPSTRLDLVSNQVELA